LLLEERLEREIGSHESRRGGQVFFDFMLTIDVGTLVNLFGFIALSLCTVNQVRRPAYVYLIHHSIACSSLYPWSAATGRK